MDDWHNCNNETCWAGGSYNSDNSDNWTSAAKQTELTTTVIRRHCF